MKYIKAFETRKYIRVSDYVKLIEKEGFFVYHKAIILDGTNEFKNWKGGGDKPTYYAKVFLDNPDAKSEWVNIWLGSKEVERKLTPEEIKNFDEDFEAYYAAKKYNL